MPQMVNADAVALQLEKVRERLPLLYEREGTFFSMLQQRGDVEQVSSRNMRVPLQIRPGPKREDRFGERLPIAFHFHSFPRSRCRVGISIAAHVRARFCVRS